MLENGVQAYVHAVGKIENYFPIDSRGNVYACCTYCQYYSRSYNSCKITGEIIVMADKYVGNNCPFEIEEG